MRSGMLSLVWVVWSLPLVACAPRSVIPVPPAPSGIARGPASGVRTGEGDRPATPAPRPDGCPEPPTTGGDWTTLPGRDACCLFAPGQWPDHLRHPSRKACEDWVRARTCRPGSSCSDGCNTRSCSSDGMAVRTTIRDCDLRILTRVEFAPGSSVALELPRGLVEVLGKLTRAGRQIRLSGGAAPSEGSPGARSALARKRAEVVRAQLVTEGLTGESLSVTEGASFAGVVAEQPAVTFQIYPPEPRPEDFGPDACKRKNYCWCPPGLGAP